MRTVIRVFANELATRTRSYTENSRRTVPIGRTTVETCRSRMAATVTRAVRLLTRLPGSQGDGHGYTQNSRSPKPSAEGACGHRSARLCDRPIRRGRFRHTRVVGNRFCIRISAGNTEDQRAGGDGSGNDGSRRGAGDRILPQSLSEPGDDDRGAESDILTTVLLVHLRHGTTRNT